MKKIGWLLVVSILPCLATSGEGTFLQPSLQMTDRFGAPMRGFLSARDTYYYPVTLGEISPWFIAAAVAAEDKRFYQHHGVDVQAILRAGWQNTQKGEILSGASTITQQLVRAIEPRSKTWGGKFREALQAQALEKEYTKEEILEQYFNRVEFGNLTQGVQAASQFYFGVDAADVSLAQAAFLIGLIQSPARYNPHKYLARALKRQQYVLERMKQNQFIDEEMYRLALTEKITLVVPSRPFEAPHFTRFLRTLLPAQTTQVQTTLEKDLQVFAQQIVKNHIRNLQEEHVTNGAAVIMDNATGAVLAYVGSADFNNAKTHGQVDGVRALRQPGSSLKPFVYALAFEKGLLTPATLLEDKDTFFEGGFRPHNYDEKFHGLVSARQALACSYNIPAVKVAEKIGAAGLLDFLHRAGLDELDRPADFYGLGLSLGNGEVQLLHLTNAYATLARGGFYKPLVLAWQPLVQLPGTARQLCSEQTAYLISHILADNHARAEAFGLNSALAFPFEVAAKTGTSKDYKDNFALAYTPRWTVGVWVGNFDATSMRKVSGVTGAGPILHDLVVYLQQKYPSPAFAVPKNMAHKAVCNQSGLLAGPSCKDTHEEIFWTKYLPATCNGRHAENASLKLLSPQSGDIYQWDPAVGAGLQKMLWQAQCPTHRCTWVLDGKKQKDTACRVWWLLQPGAHELTVSCGKESVSAAFEVLP